MRIIIETEDQNTLSLQQTEQTAPIEPAEDAGPPSEELLDAVAAAQSVPPSEPEEFAEEPMEFTPEIEGGGESYH